MQPHRVALVALLVGAVLPVVPASAAPPKVTKACLLITDVEGDGTINPLGLKSPALDILSADVSSGRNEVTAIMRLQSGTVENDYYLLGGAQWNLNLTVGGIKYSFYARWTSVFTNGTNQELGGGLTAGSNPSTPPATFRREGNNFVWTVSRAAMPALKKPKTYLYPTGANSGADSLSADSAAPAKPNIKYLDKSPSCLVSK